MATLITLVNFNGTDGAQPQGALIADAQGDLFGTTASAGSPYDGTVFELVNTSGSYTLDTLESFNFTDGSEPQGALIADAKGDLFGTTDLGGSSGSGTVFELVNTSGSYTLDTLVNFRGTDGKNPQGSLIADANGDLFGTTISGGSSSDGTVFELVHTSGSYTLDTLVNFSGTDGENPRGSLIADANGDLFGTTVSGGSSSYGTVFELVHTSGSYTLDTLVNFSGTDGKNPQGSLIADAKGDLFGTTFDGGTSGDGTVFELVNTSGSYTLDTLESFNTTDGANPAGALIADAKGDLFGTTFDGGTSGDGTVFELVNTSGSYTLNTLLSFNDTDGALPYSALIADAQGDLFGTTLYGGSSGSGTAFEITDSGFVTSAATTDLISNTFTSGSSYSVSLDHAISDANSGGDIYGLFTKSLSVLSSASSIAIDIPSSPSSAALSLDGDTYTLTGSGSFADLTLASGMVTIENLNLASTGGSALRLASGTTAVFELGSASNDFSAPNIGVVSAPITGAGDVVIDGASSVQAALVSGTSQPLIFNAANTYTGSTTITGELVLGANGSIADSTGVNLTQSGATLDISEAESSVGGVTTETVNNLTGVIGSLVYLGYNELSVNETGSGTTFSGVIENGDATGPFAKGQGGLTVTGSGTLTLTADQGYQGSTLIYGHLALSGSSGVIEASSNVALKASGASLTLAAGPDPTYDINTLSGVSGTILNLNSNTLDVDQQMSATFNGAINGGTSSSFEVDGNAALTLSDFEVTSGTTAPFTGELVVDDCASLILTGSSTIDTLEGSGSTSSITGPSSVEVSGTLSLSGVTAGAGLVRVTDLSGDCNGVVELGANTLVVDYTSSGSCSTFSGDITGSGGLQVGESGSFYSFTRGTLHLDGDNTYTGSTKIYGDLALGTYCAIADSSNVALKISGATLDVSCDGAKINELSGVAGTNILLGCQNLSVTQDVNNATFSGVISGGLGSSFELASVCSGTNYTLSLAGDNTYYGDTWIDAGTTLALINNGSIADSQDVNVNGTLDISNAAGGVTINNLSGCDSSASIDLGSNTLTVGLGYSDPSNNQTQYDGVIIGTGGLTLVANNVSGGCDVLTLNGVNTYTGQTHIGSGTTLVLGVDGAIADTAKVFDSGVLQFSGAGPSVESGAIDTFSKLITGTGSVYVEGCNDPSVTLTRAETYTGETYVGDSATLTLGTSASISSSTLVYVDGTLDLSQVGGAHVDPTIDILQLGGGYCGLVTLGSNTLDITGSGSTCFDGDISGTGGVTVGSLADEDHNPGGATLMLGGDDTYTGKTIVYGTLTLDDATLATNNVTLKQSAVLDVTGCVSTINELTGQSLTSINLEDSAATLAVAETGVNASYQGVISGCGNLDILAAPSTLTLTGVDTYSGSTTIDTGGNLALSGAGSIADSYQVNLSGTLNVGGVLSGATSINDLNGSATGYLILDNTTVTDTENVSSSVGGDTYAGVIAGPGGFVEIGTTAGGGGSESSTLLTLTGASTFTGELVIAGGTVEVTGLHSAGSGTISFYENDSVTSTNSNLGVLQIDNSALSGVGTGAESFANTIDFSTMNNGNATAIIDLRGLLYEGNSGGSSITYEGNGLLAITEGNVTVDLHTTGITSAAGLSAYEDSQGGTFLVYDTSGSVAWDASHFHP